MTTRLATAQWADPALVEERYLYRAGDVWLGRSPNNRQLPIGYSDDRHVCLVSGSRGGKGTSSIINNLCLWPGSVVVVDPKGENAGVTVPRRGRGSSNCEGLHQAVHVLDPFKAAQVDDSYRSRFNPLDALNPENEESIDEAGRLADAIVVIHESNDPFWDESARSMVKGLILHVLTAEEYEGRRNLITLRKLITRGDWEAVEALRQSGEQQIPPAHGLLWARLATNPAFEGLVAGIGDTFTNMLLNSPKQFESVLQVANRNTEFIDSPPLQRCLEASDFELSALKTSREGMSLYLCLPQRYMNTHYRWLRMMISLTVTEMEIVRGRPATGFPVLMVLDEFAGLKRMEVIEHAVAQIAGYGVKLFFVLQTLEQLKAVYKDNWETFLSNSGLKIFFSLDDHFSREYVSKLVGETELVRDVRSSSDSESESESISKSVATSLTRGLSISKGRNKSTTKTESKGVNSSRTKSKTRTWGESWTPKGLLQLPTNIQDSRSRSFSNSRTEGTSRGWSNAETEGTSESTSESEGSTRGETEGSTFGVSRSRTTGMSETVHRRALLHPDEIGQVFARVDDRKAPAYPGLELIVISGQHPIALKRVHYYEDLQFAGRFQPHPDYPQALRAKESLIDGQALEPWIRYLTLDSEPKLLVDQWVVSVGQIVSAGDPVADMVAFKDEAGHIRSPRDGMIAGLPGRDRKDGVPHGALFSLRHFEAEVAETDPFADIVAFCEKHYDRMKRAVGRLWMKIGIVSLLALGIAGLMARSEAFWGAVITLGIGAGAVFLWWKKLAEVKRIIRQYPSRTVMQEQEPAIFRIFAQRRRTVLLLAALVAVAVAAVIIKKGQNTESAETVPGTNAQASPAVSESRILPKLSINTMLAYGLEGHSDAITSVAFSSHGNVVASGSDDRTIKLWDAATGSELRTLTGHAYAVTSVAFSPDGRLLASGSRDKTIKIWDASTGSELRTLAGHKNDVNSVAFSPDGRVLASGSDDQTIKLWEVGSGRKLLSLTGHADSVRCVTFSPDGRLLASGSNDDTIKLWGGYGGGEVRTLRGHKSAVVSVAFSPDGRLLASGSVDDTVELWDVTTGQALQTLAGHKGTVESISFSPDGRVLVSASDDNTSKLWDVAAGVELGAMGGYKAYVEAVAFGPDGRLIASGSGDHTVRIWRVVSEK